MNDDSWLTMVALREPLLPPLDHVFAAMPSKTPWDVAVSDVCLRDHATTWRWGNAALGLTLVPRPIPSTLFEGPCANAWYWPAAHDVLRDHTSHLLVQMVDESRNLIDKALRLSVLTSAVAQAAAATAIYWTPAGLVHEPVSFAEQVDQSTASSLPLYLWIDFRIHEQPGGRIDLFTTGLQRYGKREIELEAFPCTPQQMLEWAYNLAHYCLERTAAVKDGDTFGLPDGTRFTVQHALSRVDDSTPVLRLERIEQEA